MVRPMGTRRLGIVVAGAALLAGLAWWALADEQTPGAEKAMAPGPVAPVLARASPPEVRRGDAPSEEAEDRTLGPTSRLNAAAVRGAGTVSDDGGSTAAIANAREVVQAWIAQNAADAEKYVDRYCEETKALRSNKTFTEPPRTRDAALFMAGRTDWEGGVVGLLHLPASLTERMSNPPGAWRTMGSESYAGLDFVWMHELLAFDYWSLLATGPLRDHPDVPFFEAPLPNYVTLQTWSKLRLLKGLREGDLAAASLEVRHLADLIASSGTLLGEMIRVAIHGIERKTWDDAGLVPPDPPLTDAERFEARHAAFAGMYFLYPGVARAVREKALKCVPSRCSALVEAIGASSSLAGLVPSATGDVEWLLAQAPCDPALAAQAAKAPPITAALAMQNFNGERSLEKSMRQLTDGGL